MLRLEAAWLAAFGVRRGLLQQKIDAYCFAIFLTASVSKSSALGLSQSEPRCDIPKYAIRVEISIL